MPVDRGPLELVDDHQPGVWIDGDTRPQRPRADRCSGSDPSPRARRRLRPGDPRRRTSTPAVDARNDVGADAAEQRPAASGRRRERLRDVGVVTCAAGGRPDHLDHLTPEGVEYVGELGGDEPAAEDDDRARQLVELHDRVRGVDRADRAPARLSPAPWRRLPAATTHRSAVTTVPVPVSSSLCPTNRAVPVYTVTFGHSGPWRYALPAATIGSMRPNTRSRRAGQSTCVDASCSRRDRRRRGLRRRGRPGGRTSSSGRIRR